MKKLIMSILLFVNFAYGAGNMGEKPVFLLLWSNTCTHCSAFLNGSMKDERLLKFFDVEAINVGEVQHVPYDIDFTGVVPSVHILNQNKNQLTNTITGNIPPAELSKFLSKFLELWEEYKRAN